MNELIKQICNDILRKYQQDKNILGVMLFGSAVRDKFDQHSDIDIFVLLNKKGRFSRFNFIKNGTRVDIMLDTKKEAQKYLKEDKHSFRRITSYMLAHGKIIFQRNNNLSKVQNIARKNLKLRTKYNNEEILMHKYSIDDFWGEVQRDIRNKDYLAFGIDSYLLINNIIELIIKLHGEFSRQPNEMTELLNKIDKGLSSQIQKFYTVQKIQDKERILADLVKYVYKKSGGGLSSRWTIK